MHELSIAHQLVRLAESSAQDAGALRVRALFLRLGPQAGVVREALEFAYDFACEGTLLAGSSLVIEDVPLVVRCAACGHEGAPVSERKLRCTRCDEATPDILSGRELEIRALDIQTPSELASEDPPTASPAHGAAANDPNLPDPASDSGCGAARARTGSA